MNALAQVVPARSMNFVNGNWVESTSTRLVERRNPANFDDVVGMVNLSTREETRAAVQTAAAAFPAWRSTPAPVRGRIIGRAAQIMTQRKDELGRMLTREEGKTLSDSSGEILRSINVLDYMAGEGKRIGGEMLPSELPKNFAYTMKQPLGVVACITPWNFPVAIPAWKIAPALVAGNTVIFKPASLTPLCAAQVVQCFVDAGLPNGVLNMVLGVGETLSRAITSDDRVKAISFTGSSAVGRRLYTQAAERLCKVQLEMGGKNAVIVMDDADLEKAAESVAVGAFGATGQRCTATSRAVVVRSVLREFNDALAAKAETWRAGDGLEAGVRMGPIVDETQLRKV